MFLVQQRFSPNEKRAVLGSYAKVADFYSGVDVEEIFNRLRPKYPIRRYVDVFGKKLYNRVMKKYEKAILNKFEKFDVSSKVKAIESFKYLWMNEKIFEKYLKK